MDPPESGVGNKTGELKDKPSPPVESACSHDSQHVWADKQSSPVQSTEPKMESPPTVQQSSNKEAKQQRYVNLLYYSFSTSLTVNKCFNHIGAFFSDQQRRQMKQTLSHEQHQQILKQLEKHRPTRSVRQKQPAGERTDVLYDFVRATRF